MIKKENKFHKVKHFKICKDQHFPFNFQLAADPDINVKNGSELLDRLMKVKKNLNYKIHNSINFLGCDLYLGT